MIKFTSFTAIPPIYLQSYFIVVIISFLYILFKANKNSLNFLIILLFYPGLFSNSELFNNLYKILLLGITILVCINKNAFSLKNIQNNKFIVFSFFLFSASLLLSGIFNQDSFLVIFSQYSKYLIVFLSFFIIYNEFEKFQSEIPQLVKLIRSLIIIQIGLTIFKLIILGVIESIVGSITYRGGAVATVFPIVVFIFIWSINAGKLQLKDWLIILGLLILGFASNKRAIWFILPAVILIFTTYVARRKLSINQWGFIFFLPLVLYFGIRLNPTLNPEKKIWGSFDLDYTLNYVERYSFGEKNVDYEKSQGRGGATLMLFDKILNFNYTNNDLLGYGIEVYNTSDYEEFEVYDFGIQSKGAAAGFFQSYIATGFIGICVSLLFFLSLITKIKLNRYTYVILGIFIWEYFFYTGILFRIQVLPFILLFSIFLRKHIQ